MGWNTSMIILNDCLHDIRDDAKFGEKVYDAVSRLDYQRRFREEAGRKFYGVDVSAGCSVNAATVIDTHHADETSVIAFGGNQGLNLGTVWAYGDKDTEEVRVLKALADKYGYNLQKKTSNKVI